MGGLHLQELTNFLEEDVNNRLFHGLSVPLADERARILREMSSTALDRFGGSFVKLINSAGKSAVKLLNILT